MQQQILRAQSRIFKNRANKELYKFVKENPDNELGFKIETDKGKLPNGMVRVTSWKDGKVQNV